MSKRLSCNLWECSQLIFAQYPKKGQGLRQLGAGGIASAQRGGTSRSISLARVRPGLGCRGQNFRVCSVQEVGCSRGWRWQWWQMNLRVWVSALHGVTVPRGPPATACVCPAPPLLEDLIFSVLLKP